jgi:hypothetical protein
MTRRTDQTGEASELPPDEVVDLRCVWAVRFHTLSRISDLLRGF